MQIQKKLDQEEAEQKSTEPATEHTDSGCETMSEEEEDSADLWVEKYRPKSYLELLSDEVIASSTDVHCDTVSTEDEPLVEHYYRNSCHKCCSHLSDFCSDYSCCSQEC
jgi:hypothetical protein